jgi:putative ubiquitin-RnfH superfamily antitoxin RatB of RatAB toxin-antitoxin module
MMNITVAYATSKDHCEISLEVSPEATVAWAIRQSGILERFPEIPFPQVTVGIWGAIVTLDTPLPPGARVEIYRPITIDPKVARRDAARGKIS